MVLSTEDKLRLVKDLCRFLRENAFYQTHPHWQPEIVEALLHAALAERSTAPDSSTPAKAIHLYVDGASRGNPGHAGIGLVLQSSDGTPLEEISHYIGETTNNRAEYVALREGLRQVLKFRPEQLSIFMDSELVVKQLKGEYKTRNPDLQDLQKQVKELLRKIPRWKIEYIPRQQNRLADQLANRAIDKFLQENHKNHHSRAL